MANCFLRFISREGFLIDEKTNASDDDSSTENSDKTRLEYQHAGPSQNTVLGFGQEKQPITAAASKVPWCRNI
jgi:hypothetical protein